MDKKTEKKPNPREIQAGNLQTLQELKYLKSQLAAKDKEIEALKAQVAKLTPAQAPTTPPFDLKAPDFKIP